MGDKRQSSMTHPLQRMVLTLTALYWLRNNNGNTNQRLLRHAGREEDGLRGRDSQGIPQTRAQIPPRRKSRRQEGGREIQRDLRSQRCSQRSQEAQNLRPGRLLLRQHRSSYG